MKYTIWSDLHWYGPHSICDRERDLKEILYPIGSVANVMLTGDIVDCSNAPKKKLKKARDTIQRLKNIYKENIISGNHEVEITNKFFTIKDDIMFTHGHWKIFWSDEKVKEWQYKKAGKGRFSRSLYAVYKNVLMGAKRNLDKTYTPSEEVQERVFMLAREHNVRVVVCGHRHKSCDVMIGDVRFITVGPGKTVLDL